MKFNSSLVTQQLDGYDSTFEQEVLTDLANSTNKSELRIPDTTVIPAYQQESKPTEENPSGNTWKPEFVVYI